jgi:O-antigen ligase
MLWAVITLLLTAVLCRSTGALALGAVGYLTLALSQWMRAPIAPILLLAVPPLYVGLRTSSLWSGEEAVGWLGANFDEGRAQSLDFRLENENQLVDKALENPVFGWGGWGRSRIRDAEGKEATVADGLWIIALGERGFVGLVALGLTLLLPAARFARAFPPRRWSEPAVAPAAAAAVVLMLFAIDCLMNAMVNPVYLLAAGGLAGLICPNAPAHEYADATSLRGRRTGRAAKTPGGFVGAETARGN